MNDDISMRLRYRRMERVLGEPILETHRRGADGGGARLTAAARNIVAIYREWRTELLRSSDEAFARVVARHSGAARHVTSRRQRGQA